MLVMRTSSLRSATCTDTLALLAVPKRYGYSCKKSKIKNRVLRAFVLQADLEAGRDYYTHLRATESL